MSANENHRAAIERAFHEYLMSDYFQGHVYPGQFYEFCNQKPKFNKINHLLCSRVRLFVESLAMKAEASFRRSAPAIKTVQQAKIYLKIAFECAKTATSLSSELKALYTKKLFDDFLISLH
jgi:hypothetical protein